MKFNFFSAFTVRQITLILLVLMLVLTWAEGYRFFAYLNLVAVVIFFIDTKSRNQLARRDYVKLLGIFFIPIAVSALHILAVWNLEFPKEIQYLWLATFVTIGVWSLAFSKNDAIKSNIFYGLIFFYVSVQLVWKFVFGSPYGTATNPHYIALYSALILPIGLYYVVRSSGILRYMMIFSSIFLIYFILESASRPTWIALFLTACVAVLMSRMKRKWSTLLAILLIPFALYMSNALNFGERVRDLAENITTEERTIIWKDAWDMQKSSSITQWVVGHGINSYRDNFRAYSRYDGRVEFKSPHNFLLEVLYLCGVLGLILFFWVPLHVLKAFIDLMNRHPNYRSAGLTLISMLLIGFISTSIILPAFSRYYVFTIAFIAGGLFFMQQSARKELDGLLPN